MFDPDDRVVHKPGGVRTKTIGNLRSISDRSRCDGKLAKIQLSWRSTPGNSEKILIGRDSCRSIDQDLGYTSSPTESNWRENRAMRKHDPNNNNGGAPGHSRRDFLRGSGLAAASAVLTGGAAAAIDEAAVQEAGPKVVSGAVEITLKVNGQEHKTTVEP